MKPQWVWVTFLVAVSGYEFTDEQYYSMPRLFQMDDYVDCFSRRGNAYCLGSFDLLEHSNPGLLQVIRNFSNNKYHFDHTHLHRGVCISTRCASFPGTLQQRFERCVDNITISQYGLQANLTKLEYCARGRQEKRIDSLDIAFAWFCAALVLMNFVGTAYDVFRDTGNKPNKLLMAWSLCANWRRLTADYSDGDPRLAALRPVQGMKALTLILIMLAHSVLAYHITYIYNPLFLEKASHHPMSAYFQNGTSIVQTFIMASSFLLAYNLLLHSETSKKTLSLSMFPKCLLHRITRDHQARGLYFQNGTSIVQTFIMASSFLLAYYMLLHSETSKKTLSLSMCPKCLLHRITRISPIYIFVLGMAMTWWYHASSGALWGPLVGGECVRCRDKWWTQLLFINNLVRPEVKCLIHTWFLAVDMQLYVVSSILTLILGSRPRLALKVLPALFCAAVLGNFAAAYVFNLKPMVKLMFPEYMRTQFDDEASFLWLYQAPWDSLPSALVGLFVAFLHFQLQSSKYKPADSLRIRVLYRTTIPAMFLWVFAGYLMKAVSQPALVALYAALDRPVFISLTAFAMYCFFNQVDSLWWRFLCWRGWEVLGRMSLTIYLVHWLFTLSHLAYKGYPSSVSVPEIGGHFAWTVFTSYCAAVPLHLAIELPVQRFLQAIL